ncbi:MAG: hypothetical protein Q8Q49_03065 [bacterium]|nr:hypothetical protein [bacterium]
MVGFIKKATENSLLNCAIIVFFAFLTFIPTLFMFFYADDFAYLYKLSQGESFLFPYQHSASFIKPFYLLFGLNPLGYFVTGVFMLALSAVVLYLFASRLLRSKRLGLLAGIICATTPVGIDTVFQIGTFINGYITTIGLLVLLILLHRSVSEKKTLFYVIALLSYVLFLELKPVRVFLFVPVLAVFDYVMHGKHVLPDRQFLKRQVPFALLFILYFEMRSFVVPTHATLRQMPTMLQAVKDTISAFFDMQPFIALANVLTGAPLVFLANTFAISTKSGIVVSLETVGHPYIWTALTLLVALGSIVLTWQVKREWGKLQLFCVLWIYITILGFYVFSSPGVSETTARTVTQASPAYAVFFTLAGFALFTYLKAKKYVSRKALSRFFVFCMIAVVAVNIFATWFHLNRFNELRSRHAYAFFHDLKQYYPSVPVDSLLYIKIAEKPYIQSRFYNIIKDGFYGGRAGFAVFYGYAWDEINYTREYSEVLKFVGKDPKKIDRVFAFSFDDQGLSDMTTKVRTELKKSDTETGQ